MFSIRSRHTLGLAILAMLALTGCETPGSGAAGSSTTAKSAAAQSAKPELPRGYTCCNFHHEGDWISDSNYTTLPMIPAGTPATVTGYGRHRAYAEIGGTKMRLGHDYGREQQTLQQWTAKMIVADDPKQKIAGYPADIQAAIRQGRIAPGMTREQVIISVGYPLTSENASLDAPVWRMWVSSFGEYHIVWDASGKVKEIAGDPLTRNLVVHHP